MASFGIGAKLRQERVGKGLEIDDIARKTRIAPRFLEAIETDDYSSLPGLTFTRSWVRQYALTLQVDPEPLLAELPKHDESTFRLPDPPARPRSSYHRDRRIHAIKTSIVWIVLIGGAGLGAYMYFNHSLRAAVRKTRPADAPGSTSSSLAKPEAAATVQVSLTAHEVAWIQVSVDGKPTFTGTLKPNETKEVSAAEQVRLVTGNAGALTVSLNGKTLSALGPAGEVRVVKLTAEGPQFLSKGPPPATDPL